MNVKVILFLLLVGSVSISWLLISTESTQMRDITASELTKEMVTGWNLGNSFDVRDRDKTVWGNPLPSKEIIDNISARGFKTLRIPVTWSFHMGDAPDYLIEEDYLERVADIVRYGLDNDMYVIINTHHDDWIVPTYESEAEVSMQLEKLWTQVAERFKTYSDFLLFETMNEPRVMGSPIEWTGDFEGRDVINNYNQICVDAIRATGGNNAERFLIIPTYAANTQTESMDQLKVPNDDSRIIISMHTYFPYDFTLNEAGSVTWGTEQDKENLSNEFQKIHQKFIANGQAVILGEWGAINKNNDAERLFYYQEYARQAAEKELPLIVWDDGGQFQLFSRHALSWTTSGGEIADSIISTINSAYGITEEEKPLSFNRSSNIINQIYWVSSKTDTGSLYINFELSKKTEVDLKIFDLNGKLIQDLSDGELFDSGFHRIVWNGASKEGSSAPEGVYIAHICTQSESLSMRLTLKH